MKKLSILTILIVTFFIGSQFTFAQDANMELKEIATNKTEKLTSMLKLDSEQSSLVQKAFNMYEIAVNKLKANKGIDADFKQQVAKLKKNMNAILNDSQYNSFEELLSKKNLLVEYSGK